MSEKSPLLILTGSDDTFDRVPIGPQIAADCTRPVYGDTQSRCYATH
jgi:hypothetical protein